MNDFAPDNASLQSTPITRPAPAGLCEKRSIAGASCTHGPHQLAQKTTAFERPPAESDWAAGPARRSRGSAGAGRPRAGDVEERPKIASAASAQRITSAP